MILQTSTNKHKATPGKGNVFEITVSITLFLVFVLVVATGILSYLKLSHIVDTVNRNIRPDHKLILVKEIYNDLTDAENSVKSYSLTKNQEDMIRFYRLTETTGDRLEELFGLVSVNNDFEPYYDTLDVLVGEKFYILNTLLVIQDEFRVQQVMQQVMQSIGEHKEKPIIENTDTLITGVPEKRESFFKRLFRSRKDQQEIDSDTITYLDSTDTRDYIEDISQQMQAVQQDAMMRERTLRKEEWELLQQDKIIMQRIRKLLAAMEYQETEKLLLNYGVAEKQAEEIRKIISAFGIAASVLLMLVAFVLFRYVKKNNEYRAVLQKARKDAEELAGAKELFLANMSHEIRTPMNIVSGYLHQVLNDPLEPQQEERLRIIQNASNHLLRLLNDLLDLSRLQADKLEVIEGIFNPEGLISEVFHSLEPAARTKKISLNTDVDPRLPNAVSGDPVRLRQILYNLVGNAIKFTETGQVLIKAYPIEHKLSNIVIRFEVIDTGMGIKQTDLERIFVEFEQLPVDSVKNTEGAGLGLAITRKLVTLIGGNIHVESQPGKGSTFRVDIPFRLDSALPVTRPVMDRSALLKNKLVLVVDDEPYNRSLIKSILERSGCRVLEASDGEGAIRIVEEQAVDIVLMDIRLPGIQGPAAAAEIKRIAGKQKRSIPVIAVSAAINKGDVEKYRKQGMDEFILKPFEVNKLFDIITRFFPHPAPRYDLTSLIESSAGNEKFLREMLGLFIQGTENGLMELGHLIGKADWEAAADLAHKISSPCGHMKAVTLHSLIKQLEAGLKGPGTHESVIDLLSLAKSEFELIREDLRKNYQL